MDVRQWFMLITCAGLLGLGFISFLRLRASPLAAPLAALCLFGFVFRFDIWYHSLRGQFLWPYTARIVFPLLPVLAVHLVVVFLGRRRSFRLLLRLSYALDLSLSLLAFCGLFWPVARRAAVSGAWESVLAGQVALCGLACAILLLRHAREQTSPEERMRARLMLAADVVVVMLVVLHPLLPPGHLLLALLLALALSLLTVVAFGFRLFDSALTGLGVFYLGALVFIALGGYALSVRLAPGSWGVLALACTAIGACLAAALIEAIRAMLQQSARLTRLTALGRWSSHMAHDFKNPLAALKGAAQFLLEERAQGRSIDNQQQFLALLVSESDRLAGLIERYQHFGGVGIRTEIASLNALVERVLAGVYATLPENVRLQVALDPGLSNCVLDPQLALVALENVICNALEAMPQGGSLSISTSALFEPDAPPQQRVAVRDTGRGMNPRELELAFDDFFSTKDDGRGLGLPMVKRVIEAHGGSVRMHSRLGQGTCLTLTFPGG